MKPTVISAEALFDSHRAMLKWEWIAGHAHPERRFDEVAVLERPELELEFGNGIERGRVLHGLIDRLRLRLICRASMSAATFGSRVTCALSQSSRLMSISIRQSGLPLSAALATARSRPNRVLVCLAANR